VGIKPSVLLVNSPVVEYGGLLPCDGFVNVLVFGGSRFSFIVVLVLEDFSEPFIKKYAITTSMKSVPPIPSMRPPKTHSLF
jgi:hypothetical protein